jgi:hypothetical protein
MALLMALVFKNTPSLFAPYLTMLKVSFLKTGCITFGSMEEAQKLRFSRAVEERVAAKKQM